MFATFTKNNSTSNASGEENPLKPLQFCKLFVTYLERPQEKWSVAAPEGKGHIHKIKYLLLGMGTTLSNGKQSHSPVFPMFLLTRDESEHPGRGCGGGGWGGARQWGEGKGWEPC